MSNGAILVQGWNPYVGAGLYMPWIEAADVYGSSNMKIMSINPKAINAVSNLNQAVTLGSSALTRVQEEAIARAVLVTNI